MEPNLARIGVIYLCRFAEGERPVRAFVDSYRAHPAGAAHDLHVIFKGFSGKSSVAARALFGELPLHPIELEDRGYDLGSYFAAARLVDNRRLVFFNTFTELLADNWLKKFDDALSLPDVGLVGATGSWQSHRSLYRASWQRALYWIGHPLEYVRRSGADRLPIWDSRQAEAPTAPTLERNGARGALGQIGRSLYHLIRFDRHLLPYAPYPNPHIRTNAFMVERDRFLTLRIPSFRTKWDVYRFESGRDSLTSQIIAQGLKPVVVDRNGDIYELAAWKASSTYWIDGQKNLIAADNRTRDYSDGTPSDRARLQAHAWDDPLS
jgi:hypothetical protein